MSGLAVPPLPFPDACARMNSTDCTNIPEEPPLFAILGRSVGYGWAAVGRPATGIWAVATTMRLQLRQATQAARGVPRVRPVTAGWSSRWPQGKRRTGGG